MDDLISRQAAIDAVCMEWCGVKHQDCKHPFDVEKGDYYWCDGCETVLRTLPDLPSAQQDCTECPDYDHETHSCPKYCRVIRQTLEEAEQERTGRWIYGEDDFMTKCSECGCHPWFGVVPTTKEATKKLPHCPMCRVKMEESNESD